MANPQSQALENLSLFRAWMRRTSFIASCSRMVASSACDRPAAASSARESAAAGPAAPADPAFGGTARNLAHSSALPAAGPQLAAQRPRSSPSGRLSRSSELSQSACRSAFSTQPEVSMPHSARSNFSSFALLGLSVQAPSAVPAGAGGNADVRGAGAGGAGTASGCEPRGAVPVLWRFLGEASFCSRAPEARRSAFFVDARPKAEQACGSRFSSA
mmetsp:Transcript_89998/g.254916  ORF Transcript_89998/g.254916 Transcript_89998/m.254916 type:complete len:216 (+) Transcript_89998:990-1637(+)